MNKTNTRIELEKRIKKVKKGCGVKIGVPIFTKFKPCGETHKGHFYFCEECKYKLSQLETTLRWVISVEKEK